MVQRVAPEESENIDDFILQFHGQRHELIETLKIMEHPKLAQESNNCTTASNMRVGASTPRSLATGTLTQQRKGSSSHLSHQVSDREWMARPRVWALAYLQTTPQERKKKSIGTSD